MFKFLNKHINYSVYKNILLLHMWPLKTEKDTRENKGGRVAEALMGFLGFEGVVSYLTTWPESLDHQAVWQWEEVAIGSSAPAVYCRRS